MYIAAVMDSLPWPYVTYQKGRSIPSQCSSYVNDSRLSQYSQLCLSNVSNLLLERDLPCIQLDHLLTKVEENQMYVHYSLATLNTLCHMVSMYLNPI